jgi:hypothetical protein
MICFAARALHAELARHEPIGARRTGGVGLPVFRHVIICGMLIAMPVAEAIAPGRRGLMGGAG